MDPEGNMADHPILQSDSGYQTGLRARNSLTPRSDSIPVSIPLSLCGRFSKENIKNLNKELRFAVDCVTHLLKDSTIPWFSTVKPTLSDPVNDRLCTDNIKNAIQQLVSSELAVTIDVFFHTWFQDVPLSYPKFKALLRLITADFCMTPYSTRKFLEYCTTVGEMSSMMFVGGVHRAPDYGIICIFYAIIHSMDTNTICDYNIWEQLDHCATVINESQLFSPRHLENVFRNKKGVSTHEISIFNIPNA